MFQKKGKKDSSNLEQAGLNKTDFFTAKPHRAFSILMFFGTSETFFHSTPINISKFALGFLIMDLQLSFITGQDCPEGKQ